MINFKKQMKPVSPDINPLNITVHNDLSNGLRKLHAFFLAPNVPSLTESNKLSMSNELEIHSGHSKRLGTECPSLLDGTPNLPHDKKLIRILLNFQIT